jgi:hypothetical protein
MKKGTFALLFVLGIASTLTACSSAKILENAYPDRHTFSFTDPDDGTKYDYLCKDNSPQHAQKAHAYVVDRTGEIAAEALGDLFKKDEDGEYKQPSFFGVLGSSMKVSMTMNKQGKVLAQEVEDQYQCILIKVDD